MHARHDLQPHQHLRSQHRAPIQQVLEFLHTAINLEHRATVTSISVVHTLAINLRVSPQRAQAIGQPRTHPHLRIRTYLRSLTQRQRTIGSAKTHLTAAQPPALDPSSIGTPYLCG